MKPYRLLLSLAAVIPWTAFCQSPGAAQTTSIVTQGSTLTHRGNVDGNIGSVYVYIGGSFPAGMVPTTFSYVWDFVGNGGNNTGYITPLLFERVPGPYYTVYVVSAIGQSFPVSINSSPQTIPFNIIKGTKVTLGANYTFGYVNAAVNANGQQIAASAGTVDFNEPAESGPGVGGSRSFNSWAATGAQNIPVALGTTFSGSGADFIWVNYFPVRTYSAQAQGIVSGQ